MKRWVLDMFVPGSAEIMMINPEQSDMYPETADFFERMAYLPLAGITEMVPPGGAGIGMHVIPLKAIPAGANLCPSSTSATGSRSMRVTSACPSAPAASSSASAAKAPATLRANGASASAICRLLPRD